MSENTTTVETQPTASDVVEIWTDGGCKPNPGPGGWGWDVTGNEYDSLGKEPGARGDCRA